MIAYEDKAKGEIVFVIVCDEVQKAEDRNCLVSAVRELAFPPDVWEERRLIYNNGVSKNSRISPQIDQTYTEERRERMVYLSTLVCCRRPCLVLLPSAHGICASK